MNGDLNSLGERRIRIPVGRLAEDDAALKARREALKKKLLERASVDYEREIRGTMDDRDEDSLTCAPNEDLGSMEEQGDSFISIPEEWLQKDDSEDSTSVISKENQAGDDAALKARYEVLKKKLRIIYSR